MRPILTLPKVGETYIVYTIISREGYGEILIQEGNVVAYTFRQLCPYKRNYITHNLKLRAVLHAMKV